MMNMAISLSWRFEALYRFSEIHLQGLQEFHVHVSKSSEEAIVAWEQACEEVTGGNSPAPDELAEERGRVESLVATGQSLGILGLYAFLENYLDLVIEQLRYSGASIPNPRQGSKLERLQEQFCEVGIDLKKPPFSWDSLNQMRVVRNCIAHTGGWIDKSFAKKLGEVGLTANEDTPLGPPEADFERWSRLVGDTFRLIHSKCSDDYYDPDLP